MEKELILALLEKCKECEISPVRILYSVDNSRFFNADSVDGMSYKESNQFYLLISGMINGNIHNYEVNQELKEEDFNSLIDNFKKEPGYPYKKEWFVEPGSRLGKTDAYASKIDLIPETTFANRCKNLINSVSKNFDGEVRTDVNIEKRKGFTWLIASNGLDITYKRNSIRINATVSCDKNEKDMYGNSSYTYSESRTYRKNIDLMDEISFGRILAYRLRDICTPIECEKGVFKAVLLPEISSTILNEGVKQLSGRKIYNGESIYVDSKGKDVFSPMLNLLIKKEHQQRNLWQLIMEDCAVSF